MNTLGSDPPVRPAATVCALRPNGSLSGDPEVLMVRRSRGSRFMGGTWVFPGGAVDDADRRPEARAALRNPDPRHWPFQASALRELAEEADVWAVDPPLDVAARTRLRMAGPGMFTGIVEAGSVFDATELRCFANWVTPRQIEVRFDARFYALPVPPDTAAKADEMEVFDATWITPATALQRSASGEWNVPHPTRVTLELFRDLGSIEAILDHVTGLDHVARIEPRIVDNDGRRFLLMPGDDGYNELPEAEVTIAGTGHHGESKT